MRHLLNKIKYGILSPLISDGIIYTDIGIRVISNIIKVNCLLSNTLYIQPSRYSFFVCSQKNGIIAKNLIHDCETYGNELMYNRVFMLNQAHDIINIFDGMDDPAYIDTPVEVAIGYNVIELRVGHRKGWFRVDAISDQLIGNDLYAPPFSMVLGANQLITAINSGRGIYDIMLDTKNDIITIQSPNKRNNTQIPTKSYFNRYVLGEDFLFHLKVEDLTPIRPILDIISKTDDLLSIAAIRRNEDTYLVVKKTYWRGSINVYIPCKEVTE